MGVVVVYPTGKTVGSFVGAFVFPTGKTVGCVEGGGVGATDATVVSSIEGAGVGVYIGPTHVQYP